jgi:YidC/Oxa1 family membrane protein insertase
VQILEHFIKLVFEFFYHITNSYGISLIFLSCSVTLLLIPCYHFTNILEKQEKKIKQKLQPLIDHINTIKNVQTRHNQLKELYREFSYSPVFSLRSLSSLLIQIPLLIASYKVLNNYSAFSKVQFFIIKDLGSPDNLRAGLNLLPILMTIINIFSVFLIADKNSKERKQGVIIAALFLIILYNSNAGLILYWTSNNFLNFLRYLWIKEKNNFKFLVCENNTKMPANLKFNVVIQFSFFNSLLKKMRDVLFFVKNIMLDKGYITAFLISLSTYFTISIFAYSVKQFSKRYLFFYLFIFVILIFFQLYYFCNKRILYKKKEIVINLSLLDTITLFFSLVFYFIAFFLFFKYKKEFFIH